MWNSVVSVPDLFTLFLLNSSFVLRWEVFKFEVRSKEARSRKS